MRAIIPILPLLFVGCLGGTQNPSYFPYLLPTGDIIRTHAKPGGIGYFRNFDPKACKIEVSPGNAMYPTKTQVVLIATVFDKDGDARRKRRVEWHLEGPGQIIEVDESGYLPGRGYQVTDKYAVSYTDMLSHTITRGNGNDRDDFTICPGQTWCVVTSAVEGQTVVTVHAPEVHDWDQRQAFSRIGWSDGPVQPFRSGRETDSTLNERAKAESTSNAPGLVLDAKLPKAVAVNREMTATISLANNGKTPSSASTVRTTIPDGVDLVKSEPPPTRRSGRDLYWTLESIPGTQARDIVLTLKPSRRGTFVLTALADTTDGLTATSKAESTADSAGMSVQVEAPKFTAAGTNADVKITVTNTGGVTIENAVAWVTPGSGETSPSEIAIGNIEAGQSRSTTAKVRADASGKTPVRVDVTANGGISARGEGTLVVGKAELMVRIVGPETVPVGDTATYEVQVVNAGDFSTSDVAVKTALPRGMSANETNWTIPTLAPGEKKVFRLAAKGDRLSELTSITATASSSNLPEAKTSAPVAIRGTPVLTLEVSAPNAPVPIGSRATYRVTIRNRGNAPARDLNVGVSVSSEMRILNGTSFRKDELAANGTATFTVECEALSAGDARITVDVSSKDLPSPLKEEQATRVRR